MPWKLFPDDAKQRLRLKRFFMAVLSYFLWVGLGLYCYALGYIDVTPRTFALAIVAIVFCNLAFFAVLRSGLNRFWPDPSLTLPQMLVATFWVVLLVALAPRVRGTFLLLYVVVFFFGIFRLRRREYLALTAVVLLSYGLVVVGDRYSHNPADPASLATLQYAVLAVTLIWLAFFGSYVGRLRETVSRRNSELAAALARNRELAIHDDLTGTYNRRHMIAILEKERQRTLRTGRGFCICLMDLDHFKQVNDQLGHLVGDDVLKQFSERVMHEVRTLDTMGRDGLESGGDFGRYGGEEFLLVLPETDMPGARSCVERIRQKVAEKPIVANQDEVRITVSCGLTVYRAGEDIRATLARADQALYRAKQAGRNRTESVAMG